MSFDSYGYFTFFFGSLKDFAKSHSHGKERLFRNVYRNVESIGKTQVEAAELGCSSREDNSLIHNVSYKLGRCLLKS